MRGQLKPTALKILHADKDKNRINENEPKPARTAPPMPKSLDALERKTWKRLGPMLERLGLLTEADGDAFATFCTLTAVEQRLREEFAKTNFAVIAVKTSFLEEQSGEGRSNELMAVEAKINPLIKEIRMIALAKRPYISMFGMDPASRTKISVTGGVEEDEFFGR